MKTNKNLNNGILIVLILLLTIFIVVYSNNFLESDKNVIKSCKEIGKAPKFLALMYETTFESGEYQVSTDSVWPSNGYAFNTILSKCENGSKLNYDKILRQIKVETIKSDKCYAYFDMEKVPIINGIVESNVSAKSMTITLNVTPGVNTIKMYHYSKDDGASYVTSTSNSYTFNNLTDETNYKIKVKVEDTNFNFSLEESKTIRTGVYALPVINSINGSGITTNSFTISAYATAGTNAIKTYYFSIDNGGSYVSSSSSSYTFYGLNPNTQYNVKVKVEDVNGRFSQISGKTITTLLANFAQTLKNNYASLGMNYHNGLANGANDGSYRFSGANPNNYVCFGPGATAAGQTCPEENQYRIIGVFGNQVKLIKKNSIGKKEWHAFQNLWENSTLDTYLNGEYLNSLTPTWNNKISINSWYTLGFTNLGIAAQIYTYEIVPNNLMDCKKK